MVKVMYNEKLVCNVVIWVFFKISLWKEKVALAHPSNIQTCFIYSEQKVYIKNFMLRFWQENTKCYGQMWYRI